MFAAVFKSCERNNCLIHNTHLPCAVEADNIGTQVIWVFAYVVSDYAAQFNFLICPTEVLTLAVHPDQSCSPPPVFVPTDIDLVGVAPDFVQLPFKELGWNTVVSDIRPVTLHMLLIAVVASLVAPFGGFMASAIKRANNVKDFDSVIPGHGGFTDRFDCQMLIALYVAIHYKTLVLGYVHRAYNNYRRSHPYETWWCGGFVFGHRGIPQDISYRRCHRGSGVARGASDAVLCNIVTVVSFGIGDILRYAWSSPLWEI
eukprot:m.886698 g.886698  ORF g.886698 m.886698 type:complete len:258 (-) comp23629_c0_seq1:59-832(-)